MMQSMITAMLNKQTTHLHRKSLKKNVTGLAMLGLHNRDVFPTQVKS